MSGNVGYLAIMSNRAFVRTIRKVDRTACPWLITRFIDREATFLFVKPDVVAKTASESEAVPFDVPGVELSHDGRIM